MRRFGHLLDSWVWLLLIVGAGSATALLSNWRPWEVVALVAVLGAAGAAVAAVSAWQEVRTRALELAALTSDEQAARLLGEAVARCGPFLPEPEARELWDTFAALSSDAKRTMTLAIVGLVGDSEQYELMGVGPKLVGVARSFGAAVGAR